MLKFTSIVGYTSCGSTYIGRLFTPLPLTAGDIGGESVTVILDLDEVVDKELGDRFRDVDLPVGGGNIS